MVAVVTSSGQHANTRGQVLHYATLAPSGHKPHGLLVFHHGLTEHSSRHLHVLEQLVSELHLLVVTFDAHGHGKSEPFEPSARSYVEDWRYMRDDLLQIVDEVALPAAAKHGAPKGRVYLAGHSMGGMMAMMCAIARPGFFTGLVVHSPLVSLTPNNSWGEWAQILGLRVLNQLIPRRPLIKRRPIIMGIRCEKSAEAVLSDTLWDRNPLKVRTVIACINATLYLQAHVGQVTEPMLIQQGVKDATCKVVALRALLPRFGSRNVTYVEVPDGFHDLHHDPDTPECVARMINWLRSHMAAPGGEIR